MSSSSASIRTLEPGEHVDYTNDTGKPVELVLQTEWGSEVRTTLPIGARFEITLGRERGRLFTLEPYAEDNPLHAV